ncbi:MAG: HD domain-containing protein [Gammaproteobacteria bacterium]|nr:HD domain-containing protein [Gammaproteobacteria bacterium]
MKHPSQSLLNSLNISADPPTRTSGVCYSSQNKFYYKEYLLSLLNDLDGIQQNPYYHPEIDALYHSLQVFQLARENTDNPYLLAAALFHDVGKSVAMAQHEKLGAEMLRGVLTEPIPWIVEHHLDLLKYPQKTRKQHANTIQLKWLEKIRTWDIQGRKTNIEVIYPELAINIITQTDEIFQCYL